VTWKPGDEMYEYLKMLADLDAWWLEQWKKTAREMRERLEREVYEALR
jgi:hypothetical protein